MPSKQSQTTMAILEQNQDHPRLNRQAKKLVIPPHVNELVILTSRRDISAPSPSKTNAKFQPDQTHKL